MWDTSTGKQWGQTTERQWGTPWDTPWDRVLAQKCRSLLLNLSGKQSDTPSARLSGSLSVHWSRKQWDNSTGSKSARPYLLRQWALSWGTPWDTPWDKLLAQWCRSQ
jgi:hypothetical protein